MTTDNSTYELNKKNLKLIFDLKLTLTCSPIPYPGQVGKEVVCVRREAIYYQGTRGVRYWTDSEASVSTS